MKQRTLFADDPDALLDPGPGKTARRGGALFERQEGNMTQKILFLGGGSPFMMKAVIHNLENAGYEVISVSPETQDFSGRQDEADTFVLFLGPSLLERTDILARLNTLCGEEGRLLFLIGTEEEQEQCVNTLSGDAVAASFTKPLDIRSFVSAVGRATARADTKELHTILLVDDDGDYLKLVNAWLSRQYRVVMVNSGMQAITYLANNLPDLILLDYAMPVTSGPQVLEMIRSEPRTSGVPVIFLTGKDDRESLMKVLELEPDGYILKSIAKRALLSRLDEFFKEKA